MVHPKLSGIGLSLWWVAERLELGHNGKKFSNSTLIKASFMKKPVSLVLLHIMQPSSDTGCSSVSHRLCTNATILSQQTLTAVCGTKVTSLEIVPSITFHQSYKADCQSSPELIPSVCAGTPETSHSLQLLPLPYALCMVLFLIIPSSYIARPKM